MSIKIISPRPGRPIVTQKGVSTKSLDLKAVPQTEIRQVTPPPPRSDSEQNDALSAAWKVAGPELAGVGQPTGDRMIIELERIVRLIERDLGRNSSMHDQLSLKEGKRFLQEYNRRLRIALNAGVQSVAAS